MREALTSADERHVALGHFNFSNLVGFTAVLAAVWKLDLPVLVRRLEGERPNRNPPGKLVALYERYVFTQGAVRYINSFYQWGVVLGKALT